MEKVLELGTGNWYWNLVLDIGTGKFDFGQMCDVIICDFKIYGDRIYLKIYL